MIHKYKEAWKEEEKVIQLKYFHSKVRRPLRKKCSVEFCGIMKQ